MLETVLFIRPTFLILSASTVILAALRRRCPKPLSAMRIIAALAVFATVSVLDYLLMEAGLNTSFEPFLHLAGIFLFGIILFGLNQWQSLYYVAWCYLLSQILSQLFMPSLSKLDNSGWIIPFKLAVYLLAEVLLYFLVRHLLADSVSSVQEGPALEQSLLTALFVLVASLIFVDHKFVTWLIFGTTTVSDAINPRSTMIGTFRIIFDMLCIAVLYIQCGLEHSRAVERELFTTRQLWQHQQSQYEISRENIELINQKCHDMKYRIRALRSVQNTPLQEEQLRDMERTIMIYDSTMNTGDPALDTVLTEKSLFCEKNGISLTCMADGDGLSFMSRSDLYAILGNALDNAIEHVMSYPEQEKRVVQVSILPKGNLHVIRVRNYCEQDPHLESGLPVSTKEQNGYHGFGLKSIRMIAEHYNGSMSCTWEDKSFLLLILLSNPANESTAYPHK